MMETEQEDPRKVIMAFARLLEKELVISEYDPTSSGSSDWRGNSLKSLLRWFHDDVRTIDTISQDIINYRIRGDAKLREAHAALAVECYRASLYMMMIADKMHGLGEHDGRGR